MVPKTRIELVLLAYETCVCTIQLRDKWPGLSMCQCPCAPLEWRSNGKGSFTYIGAHGGIRTHNIQILSLSRLPIAPHGHKNGTPGGPRTHNFILLRDAPLPNWTTGAYIKLIPYPGFCSILSFIFASTRLS